MIRSLATVGVLVAACSDDHDVPGVLEYLDGEAMIDVPSTAVVGEPIVVSVLTYGGLTGGCIYAGDKTHVESDAEGADVFPLDRRPSGEGSSCPAILLFFKHQATLTFDTVGTKMIRVHGRRVDLDIDEDIRIDFSVVVE